MSIPAQDFRQPAPWKSVALYVGFALYSVGFFLPAVDQWKGWDCAWLALEYWHADKVSPLVLFGGLHQHAALAIVVAELQAELGRLIDRERLLRLRLGAGGRAGQRRGRRAAAKGHASGLRQGEGEQAEQSAKSVAHVSPFVPEP